MNETLESVFERYLMDDVTGRAFKRVLVEADSRMAGLAVENEMMRCELDIVRGITGSTEGKTT